MIGFMIGFVLGFGVQYAWCKYGNDCDCSNSSFMKIKKKVVKANKKRKGKK